MKGNLARMITGGNIPTRKVNILWYHFHRYSRLYLVLGRIRAHPRRITSYEKQDRSMELAIGRQRRYSILRFHLIHEV